MQEVYHSERNRIAKIQARSGKDGSSELPASAFDQVNVGILTPVSIQNLKALGQLTQEEVDMLLKYASEVENEIMSRFS